MYNEKDKIIILKKENEKLKGKVKILENIIKEQNKIINAQEKVSKLAVSEHIFAEDTINAYEKVVELSRKELISAKKNIKNKISTKKNPKEK